MTLEDRRAFTDEQLRAFYDREDNDARLCGIPFDEFCSMVREEEASPEEAASLLALFLEGGSEQ